MKKSKFSETQIVAILKQGDSGVLKALQARCDMAGMTAEQRAEWERKRDLNAELLELDDTRRVRRSRKAEFLPLARGRMRRRVTRADGTVEHDKIIPVAQVRVTAAQAGTGLSQAEFARLMGVSVRTLQDWEAGRAGRPAMQSACSACRRVRRHLNSDYPLAAG